MLLKALRISVSHLKDKDHNLIPRSSQLHARGSFIDSRVTQCTLYVSAIFVHKISESGKIHVRVSTRWTNADRPRVGPRYIPDRGRPLRDERERERGRDTHAGGTTHDGHVICWTPHGHVVFHGHEVHQHCTLLGTVPRRVVSPAGPCATLWLKPIACDSNRHEKENEREEGREKKEKGAEERGAKKEAAPERVRRMRRLRGL